jgi:hypothetical protein
MVFFVSIMKHYQDFSLDAERSSVEVMAAPLSLVPHNDDQIGWNMEWSDRF